MFLLFLYFPWVDDWYDIVGISLAWMICGWYFWRGLLDQWEIEDPQCIFVVADRMHYRSGRSRFFAYWVVVHLFMCVWPLWAALVLACMFIGAMRRTAPLCI